jgi:hypothetical protein
VATNRHHLQGSNAHNNTLRKKKKRERCHSLSLSTISSFSSLLFPALFEICSFFPPFVLLLLLLRRYETVLCFPPTWCLKVYVTGKSTAPTEKNKTKTE